MSESTSSDSPAPVSAPDSSSKNASTTSAGASFSETSSNADPLARFILERQLSRAPLALSWLATDASAAPATRVLFKQFTAAFTELVSDREAFSQQVARIAAWNDRRLAPLHWAGWFDDQFYAAFEWLDDDPLDQFIAASHDRVAPAQHFELIRQAAGAVDVLHEAGLLHLALTPASFGVARGNDRKLRLLDWGLMLPGQAAQRLTGPFPGAWLDAAPYASTELLASEPPDTSDDVYSLSCVAHELLSGKHPFARRLSRDALAMTLAPAPIPALGIVQARALNDGLALQRERRAARLTDLIAAFDPALAPALGAPAVTYVESDGDHDERPQQRGSWRTLAALALALIVVFALVWQSSMRPDGSAGAPVATNQAKPRGDDRGRSSGSPRTQVPVAEQRTGPASPGAAGESRDRAVPAAPTGISGLPNPAVRIETVEPPTGESPGAATAATPDKPRAEVGGPAQPAGPAAQDRANTAKSAEAAARVATSEAAQPEATRPAKPAAAECRNCDCAAIEYKRSFTTDPIRPEEQRFFAQHCKR